LRIRILLLGIPALMLVHYGCSPEEKAIDSRRQHQMEILESISSALDSSLSGVARKKALADIGRLRAQIEQSAQQARRQEKEISRLKARLEVLEARVRRFSQGTPQRLERVELYFFTAGEDWDGDGRDDGINVAIKPLDQAGDTVKASGRCRFELYRTSFVGLGNKGRKIMEWNLAEKEVASSWLDSTFSGYYFRLPWKEKKPAYSKVILRMVFEDSYGRKFEDERLLRLNL